MFDLNLTKAFRKQEIDLAHFFPLFADLQRGVIIKYELKNVQNENQFYYCLSVVDFGGYSDFVEFYIALSNCIEAGLNKIMLQIEEYDNSSKIKFLQAISAELSCFKSAIVSKPIRSYHSLSGKDSPIIIYVLPQVEFKSSEPILNDDQRLQIQANASCFVEKYLNALQASMNDVNNLIIQFSALNNCSHNIADSELADSNKFKTAFSIHELAYFFKLLCDEELINLKQGQFEAFYRCIANNFTTVQANSFTPKSFKNKFLEAKIGVPESVHAKTKNLLIRAMRDFKSN